MPPTQPKKTRAGQIARDLQGLLISPKGSGQELELLTGLKKKMFNLKGELDPELFDNIVKTVQIKLYDQRHIKRPFPDALSDFAKLAAQNDSEVLSLLNAQYICDDWVTFAIIMIKAGPNLNAIDQDLLKVKVYRRRLKFDADLILKLLAQMIKKHQELGQHITATFLFDDAVQQLQKLQAGLISEKELSAILAFAQAAGHNSNVLSKLDGGYAKDDWWCTLLKILLKNGADPNERIEADVRGKDENELRAAKLLVAAGADRATLFTPQRESTQRFLSAIKSLTLAEIAEFENNLDANEFKGEFKEVYDAKTPKTLQQIAMSHISDLTQVPSPYIFFSPSRKFEKYVRDSGQVHYPTNVRDFARSAGATEHIVGNFVYAGRRNEVESWVTESGGAWVNGSILAEQTFHTKLLHNIKPLELTRLMTEATAQGLWILYTIQNNPVESIEGKRYFDYHYFKAFMKDTELELEIRDKNALGDAIQKLDVDAVRKIAAKADVNASAKGSVTPLAQACKLPKSASQLEIVRILISKGADVNQPGRLFRRIDKSTRSLPIYIAIYKADNEELEQLLMDNGAKWTYGQLELSRMVVDDDVHKAIASFASQNDLESSWKKGNGWKCDNRNEISVFAWAVMLNNLAAVRFLIGKLPERHTLLGFRISTPVLKQTESVNIMVALCKTYLFAQQFGQAMYDEDRTQMVAELVKIGLNANRYPGHLCVLEFSLVNELLTPEIDVNSVIRDEKTLLYVSVKRTLHSDTNGDRHRGIALVQKLILLGVDVNAQNKGDDLEFETALSYACRFIPEPNDHIYDDITIMELLLEAGAKPRAQDLQSVIDRRAVHDVQKARVLVRFGVETADARLGNASEQMKELWPKIVSAKHRAQHQDYTQDL